MTLNFHFTLLDDEGYNDDDIFIALETGYKNITEAAAHERYKGFYSGMAYERVRNLFPNRKFRYEGFYNNYIAEIIGYDTY